MLLHPDYINGHTNRDGWFDISRDTVHSLNFGRVREGLASINVIVVTMSDGTRLQWRYSVCPWSALHTFYRVVEAAV